MRLVLATLGVAAALAAVSLPARADEAYKRTFETTIPAAGATSLNVADFNGDVTLQAVDGTDSVQVNATLEARSANALSAASVRTYRTGDVVHIDDACSSRHFFFWSFADCDVDYVVRYPRGMALTVKIDNGDVSVRGASNDFDISTKHGDVDASVAGTWRGSRIAMHTSTGDVDLKVPSNFAATLEAHTRIGDVSDDAHLKGGTVQVVATSTIGDVDITRSP